MDIAMVVRHLKKERDRAAQQVERLNVALAALNPNSYGERTAGGTLSASARARIRAAQRARWAKVRASKGSANSASSATRRTMSAAARAKIARAQRLRWAKYKKSAQKRAA